MLLIGGFSSFSERTSKKRFCIYHAAFSAGFGSYTNEEVGTSRFLQLFGHGRMLQIPKICDSSKPFNTIHSCVVAEFNGEAIYYRISVCCPRLAS